ncbi:hypothetical protein HAT2_00717 [Candidatus Similichlamydia laticola]|uniref:Uncharacterized protein n=1 Tax=Candidatus Similichlamydia laticola TaxID=2170265 RepID=A0A369KEA7_9BACT|nr:hypothetical protein HAT2_00717 [Candidatus Similichlamydia laticola]
MFFPCFSISEGNYISDDFSSTIKKILRVLFLQHQRRREAGSIPLSESGREIFRLSESFSQLDDVMQQDCIPFALSLPISSLLDLIEDFLRFFICLGDAPEAREAYQQFFHSCELLNISGNLLCFQSYIRSTLNRDFADAFNLLSANGIGFLKDPFWVCEKELLDFVCNNIPQSTSRVFRERLVSNSLISYIPPANPHSLTFIDAVVLAFYASLHDLFLEAGSVFHQNIDLCTQISFRFIEFLSSRLKFLSHPCLITNLVWEQFRFSGLLIDTFSENWSIYRRRAWFAHQSIHMCNPKVEWHFRFYRKSEVSALELCQLFLEAYTLDGRNVDFNWPLRPTSEISDQARPLFSRTFSAWLNLCHAKVIPYVQAHSDSFALLCRPSLGYSLQDYAAIAVLNSKRTLADYQYLSVWDMILPTSCEMSNVVSFAHAQVCFSKFCPSENIDVWIKRRLRKMQSLFPLSSSAHLELLEDILKLDEPNLAEDWWVLHVLRGLDSFRSGHESLLKKDLSSLREDVISVLRLLPFYETSLPSFCQMQITIHFLIKFLKVKKGNRKMLHSWLRCIFLLSANEEIRSTPDPSWWAHLMDLLFFQSLDKLLQIQRSVIRVREGPSTSSEGMEEQLPKKRKREEEGGS